MPSAPLVTIITAAYNWSDVLRYAIQSVLWQTFEDFEYWVIGDCCTDDSEQVVASFSDSRIHWHNLPQNTGSQAGPNNKGLALARGKYVAYLGQDDVWYPTHLEKLVRAIDESSADFAYSMCELIGPPTNPFRRAMGGELPTENRDLWFVPPSSLMHRRDVIDDIGFWQDHRLIDRPPDHDLIYRGLMKAKRFVNTREMTVFKFPSAYRPRSYIEKPVEQQAEYIRRIREEPDFLHEELTATLDAYILLYAPRPWPKSLFSRIEELMRPPGHELERMRLIRGFEKTPGRKPGLNHLINRLLGKYDSVRKNSDPPPK